MTGDDWFTLAEAAPADTSAVMCIEQIGRTPCAEGSLKLSRIAVAWRPWQWGLVPT